MAVDVEKYRTKQEFLSKAMLPARQDMRGAIKFSLEANKRRLATVLCTML